MILNGLVAHLHFAGRAGLYHFVQNGLISPEVEHCWRQGDGGSDNVGWVTHAAHLFLVYMGVFNKITWVRGRSGHSHNAQDGDWALAKEILFPEHRGAVGPGCMSPFELEATLVEGFRQRSGGVRDCFFLSSLFVVMHVGVHIRDMYRLCARTRLR